MPRSKRQTQNRNHPASQVAKVGHEILPTKHDDKAMPEHSHEASSAPAVQNWLIAKTRLREAWPLERARKSTRLKNGRPAKVVQPRTSTNCQTVYALTQTPWHRKHMAADAYASARKVGPGVRTSYSDQCALQRRPQLAANHIGAA